MSKSRARLLLSRSRWRLVVSNGDRYEEPHAGKWSPNEPAPAAAEIAAAIEAESLPAKSLPLLLSSELCLRARFALESPRQFRNPQAMLYELEEWLPMAAEDLAAVYVRRDLEVFAVAAVKEPIEQLALALKEQGVTIGLVLPLLPLAAAAHQKQARLHGRHAAVWIDYDGRADLAAFEGGKLDDWRYLPDFAAELPRQLQIESLSAPGELPLVVYAGDGLTERPLAVEAPIEWVTVDHPQPALVHALAALQDVDEGRARPPLQLAGSWNRTASRTSPLAFEYRLLQLALLLLLAAVTFVNVRTASESIETSDRLVAAQEDVFREVFPDARLTTGVRSRLESELAKLAGVRGEGDDAEFAGSALPMLYRLLSALPADMRFRLLEVRAGAEELHLTGEVRTFSDADKIAVALRGQGLQVKPPTTQRLPADGVGFRLVAEQPPDAPTGTGGA